MVCIDTFITWPEKEDWVLHRHGIEKQLWCCILYQQESKKVMKSPQPNPQRPRCPWPRRPLLLRDDERFRLLFGPYEPPIPKRGYLVDAVRGKLLFGHYSNALIPWAKASRRGKNRSGGCILCGDLLRAVKMQAIPAICHHWGVSRTTVINWRQALGLTTRKSRTPGADRLVRLGMELARLPQIRKKIAQAAARGRVMSARHKRRFHGAMRKGWRARFKARRAACRRTGRFPIATQADPWLPEEDKLLSQSPTPELVALLGRSSKSIQNRRIQKGIRTRAPMIQRRWEKRETQLLGTQSDAEIARRLGRSIFSVRAKRHKLSLSPPTDSFWTPDEDKILGTTSDAEVAARLGRSENGVRVRRTFLRIRRPREGRFR